MIENLNLLFPTTSLYQTFPKCLVFLLHLGVYLCIFFTLLLFFLQESIQEDIDCCGIVVHELISEQSDTAALMEHKDTVGHGPERDDRLITITWADDALPDSILDGLLQHMKNIDTFFFQVLRNFHFFVPAAVPISENPIIIRMVIVEIEVAEDEKTDAGRDVGHRTGHGFTEGFLHEIQRFTVELQIEIFLILKIELEDSEGETTLVGHLPHGGTIVSLFFKQSQRHCENLVAAGRFLLFRVGLSSHVATPLSNFY